MGGGGSSDEYLAVSLPYGIPFLFMLLSIAVCPLVMSTHIFERWMEVIAATCSLAFLIPFAVQFGIMEMLYELVHVIVLEYTSFIGLIFSSFVTAGGVVIEGAGNGRPMSKTLTLALGTVVASIVGTTGASMLLIRPLLRSVEARQYKAHTFVMLIWLVSNLGGVLTPIADWRPAGLSWILERHGLLLDIDQLDSALGFRSCFASLVVPHGGHLALSQRDEETFKNARRRGHWGLPPQLPRSLWACYGRPVWQSEPADERQQNPPDERRTGRQNRCQAAFSCEEFPRDAGGNHSA